MRFVVVVLSVTGCLSAELVPCGDDLCPKEAVCTPRGCVGREAFAACADKLEADPCTTSLVGAGACHDGACTDVVCGDSVTDVGEACDDGNVVAGDGCDAACASSEACGNGLIDEASGEDCDDGNLLSSDGCASTCRAEQPTWTEISPRIISARGRFTMVNNGTLIGFGGTDGQRVLGETWLYTDTWIPIITEHAPAPRAGHIMVFDPVHDEVVLFGGVGTSGLLDDTWVFDGADWIQRTPAVAPTARTYATAAYDPVRQRVVIYGGTQTAPLDTLDETWEWDGATWELVSQGTSPLIGPAMTFDISNGYMVLYGWEGIEQNGQTRLRAGSPTWSSTQNAGAPTALHSVSMGYAPGVGAIAVSGVAGNGAIVGETWAFQDGIWNLASSTLLPPRLFAGVGMTAEGVFVLFGGFVGEQPTAEMYGLENNKWVARKLDPRSPSPRWAAAAAFDRTMSAVLVQGGQTIVGASNDARWLDERGWLEDPREQVQPSHRYAGAMTTLDDGVVLFGGLDASAYRLKETWVCNGLWSEQFPASSPSARSFTALAGDLARGEAVLFGGDAGPPNHEVADTWIWDGANWSQRTPVTVPEPRYAHAMAYDRARDRVVLFGGRAAGTVRSDTWEWDGTEWRSITPAAATPLGRYDHAMAYDPQRQRVVLFGGRNADVAPLADTWEWDGVMWTPVLPATLPPPRMGASMAYDDVRRHLVIFGGRNLSDNLLDDTWILEYTSTAATKERCARATDDRDGDGLAGCDDPDCWGRCSPTCAPGVSCAGEPRCGDGVCTSREGALLCPADCP